MKMEDVFHGAHERVRKSGLVGPEKSANSGLAEAARMRVPKEERAEIREPKVRRPEVPKMHAPKAFKMAPEPKMPKAPKGPRGGGVPRELKGKIALPPGEQAYIPSDAEYP